MLNYIRADLHRITRRVPRVMVLLLILVIFVAVLIYNAVSGQQNSIGFMANMASLFSVAGALFGLVEIMAVFADDFRAKTMQVAIGLGVSRPHVVLAKAIEFALLNLLDNLVLAVLVVASSASVGIGLNGDDIYQIMIRVFFAMLNALIPALFTMIPIFYLQGTGLAAILFLVFYIDPLAQIIGMFLSTNEVVIRLHLNEVPYSAILGSTITAFTLHAGVNVGQILGLILYIVAGYFLTVLVFHKRELDF